MCDKINIQFSTEESRINLKLISFLRVLMRPKKNLNLSNSTFKTNP